MMQLLFSLKGRIGRKTWWLTSLAVMFGFTVLSGVLVAMGGGLASSGSSPEAAMSGALLGLLLIFVPVVWTSIALGVKRLHDNDMRGWWMLISFVPVVGGLVLFVLMGFIKGDEEENRFGAPIA